MKAYDALISNSMRFLQNYKHCISNRKDQLGGAEVNGSADLRGGEVSEELVNHGGAILINEGSAE